MWNGKDGLEGDTEEKRRQNKNESEGDDSIPVALILWCCLDQEPEALSVLLSGDIL